MYNIYKEYRIKSNITIDDFIQKHSGFQVLFQDRKRNMHYIKCPLGQKMKIGYDKDDLINYITARDDRRLQYILFFLIAEEKVEIMPEEYFLYLQECELVKNSGREDQLLADNFESVTRSFLSFLQHSESFDLEEYNDMTALGIFDLQLLN